MNMPIQVLLVEDNPADADLTRECFAMSDLPIELTVAGNGLEAVDYVYKRGIYSRAATPNLVLLDLNLPGKDGKAVLREIKQDSQLKSIPVSILSSSTRDADVEQSYQLGANCYVAKPIDFASFQKVLQKLETFWFGTAKLPLVSDSER
jgi:two-component system, chemotaxis family, response regulator Rcp1